MNDATAAIVLGRRIDLTREADFLVAGVRIKPTACEVSAGGRRVRLQPRVMQVLVALARAGGRPVSRQALIEVCWGRVTVSEDALNRCIQRLRRLAETEAKRAFTIETIPRLGYRLAVGSDEDAADPPERPAPADQRSLPLVVAVPAGPAGQARSPLPRAATLAGLAIIGLAAAASLWSARDRLPSVSRPMVGRVAVLPFETSDSGGDLRAFADGLSDEIVAVLSDIQVQAVSRTESHALHGSDAGPAVERSGADLLLDGTVQRTGNAIEVRVQLDDAREHVTLWSGRFSGPADAPEALKARVAAHAADVAHWAKLGRSEKVKLDAASLAAFIAGRDSTIGVRKGSRAAALSDYQKVVSASPDFSWGHSGVASAEAFGALDLPPSPESQALRADARREAERALALDPHNGEAYLALALSAPIFDWKRREDLLLRGAAADPSFEPGAMMEGRLLWVVGRGREALEWLKRAHDLDPLHNSENWSLALDLASEGHPSESRALVAQMEAQWPEHAATKDARFWTSIVAGATEDTLALLADPVARPPGMDETSVDAWRAALKAASTKSRTAKIHAAKTVRAAADAGSLSHGEALTLLTMLGDLDDAFTQAQLYVPLDPYTAPYLFLPPTAAMRSDPRFMALARRLGLVAYWRGAGRWPDFCAEPGLRYDCRAV
jgi:DNA-binding winged helix-turn-helix (wHTH) protein/TolB-like protein/tetratricopeptide (TPR) repeat protein